MAIHHKNVPEEIVLSKEEFMEFFDHVMDMQDMTVFGEERVIDNILAFHGCDRYRRSADVRIDPPFTVDEVVEQHIGLLEHSLDDYAWHLNIDFTPMALWDLIDKFNNKDSANELYHNRGDLEWMLDLFQVEVELKDVLAQHSAKIEAALSNAFDRHIK